MELSIAKKIFEKQKENTKSKSGILLKCQRCEHNWKYRGDNPWICSCPCCHTSVRVRKSNLAQQPAEVLS